MEDGVHFCWKGCGWIQLWQQGCKDNKQDWYTCYMFNIEQSHNVLHNQYTPVFLHSLVVNTPPHTHTHSFTHFLDDLYVCTKCCNRNLAKSDWSFKHILLQCKWFPQGYHTQILIKWSSTGPELSVRMRFWTEPVDNVLATATKWKRFNLQMK